MSWFVKDKKFYKKAAGIAIPIAAQGLITIGVNMMDTIMLGSLGECALSASSLANQFIGISHTMCMGIGMGASVLISRYWGSREMQSLKKALSIMMKLCFALATIFAFVTAVAPEKIMRFYTPDTDIIYEGVRYLKWSVVSYWLTSFSLSITLTLRSVGQVKVPLFASIAAFFVNIGANYIFIFGKFGAPQMGVAGAALGTLISRILEFLWIVGYFLLIDKEVCFKLKDVFLPGKDLLNEYIRISIPVLVSDTLLGVGNSIVAVVMGHIGESFVAANAITAITVQLSTVFVMGVSQASCIVIGHTLGEGKRDRAQQEGITFCLLGTIIGLLGGGFILLISESVIGFYNITAETHAIATQLMQAVAIIVAFQCISSVLSKGVLRGGGDTRFVMVADVLFMWIVSIPIGALAGLVWHLSAFWIYIWLKSHQVIKAVWCFDRLRSRRWIKEIHGAEDVATRHG